MHFISLPYALLLLAVLLGYYVLQLGGRWRQQNLLLLGASYVFYGWLDARFCVVLALATYANFALARRIHRDGRPGGRRWLVAALVLDLCVLCYFKYLGFFAEGARDLLGLFGMQLTSSTETLWLPLGISFFTFQNIGYCLDVYNRRVAAADDPVDFALFIAFFPQLIVGPIERAARLLPQIRAPRAPDVDGFQSGAWLVFRGVFYKVFVADRLARLCDPLFAPQASYLSGDVAAAATLFALQIYADFAGYTAIARGSARMLGFELARNFRTPYLARNIQDFWARWHISLTSWITDYVYFGLAVHRRLLRVLHNTGLIVLTMVLMGFWHGAGWTFVLWGLYHGLLLAVYRKVRPLLHRATRFTSPVSARTWAVASVATTFGLVVLSELLFRPPDAGQSLAMFHGLVANHGISGATVDALVVACGVYSPVLLFDLLEHRTGREDIVLTWPWWLRRAAQLAMAYALLTAAAAHAGSISEPFHYVRF